MKPRTLPAAALPASLTLGLLTACSTTPAPPAPAQPAPSVVMGSYFFVSTQLDADGQEYATADIAAGAVLKPQQLELELAAEHDKVRFVLDRSQLLASTNWVGSYAFCYRQQPKAPVAVVYTYDNNGRSRILDLSSADKVVGDLTITAYDATRHLLSGRYELHLYDQFDPRKPLTGPLTLCDILEVGTFENIPLRE